jgi:xylulokinase
LVLQIWHWADTSQAFEATIMAPIIGIDCDRTIARAILIESGGRTRAVAERPCPEAEMASPGCWLALRPLLADLLAEARLPAIEIAAVGISSSAPHTEGRLEHLIVDPEIATASGLAPGTPVIAGAASRAAAALTAGCRHAGDALLRFGGSGEVMLLVKTPVPETTVSRTPHLIPGLDLLSDGPASAGGVLHWILEELAEAEVQTAEITGEHAFTRLDRLAAGIAPGAEGLVLLSEAGPDAVARSQPAGRSALVGFGLGHTLGHIWRAALEGAAFAFKERLAALEAVGGRAVRLLAADGGTASRVWMQIAADVIGRPLELVQTRLDPALGAALLAAKITGVVTDWSDLDRFLRSGRPVLPDAENAAIYRQMSAFHRRARGQLQGLYPPLRTAC